MSEFTSFIRTKTDEIKQAETNITFFKQMESHGACPWCGSDVYEYIKKNDKNKPEYFSFYCSQKCGFSVYSNDKAFINLTGRDATEAELKKLAVKGKIILNCESKTKGTTFKGEFAVIKKTIQETGKTYCNIEFKPVVENRKNNRETKQKPAGK